jgi:energy-coupling factor transporter ATP-binding protein EcfA2
MYLQKISIQNARSLEHVDWSIQEGDEVGWHVILGDNGAGKTTFLRATVLGILGDKAMSALPQAPLDWIRTGCSSSTVEVQVEGDTFNLMIQIDGMFMSNGALPLFSASYGPFRRFTGGDKELEKQLASDPAIARHRSLFRESTSLTEALSWLQSLRFKQLEGAAEGKLLTPILAFINQPGFLPHNAHVADVTSDGVVFVDGNAFRVPVESLSDGFRSILSMTFDLIRHMAQGYDTAKLFSADHTQIIRPGIVLIDEIDAHLHPTWQHDIGIWFLKLFPNVQFIVSTHSPIICQAAEVGSVFRLPRPGVRGDHGEMLSGIALKRLIYGNVLEAYGTGVFGDDVTRSESGKEKLQQLAELNVKELTSSLSNAEKQEQDELRSILPTEASTTSEP